MNKPPCPACQDQGWRFLNSGNAAAPTYQIQRCDACERYESDPAAVAAVVKQAQLQPALALFVEQVAGLKHEGELDEAGPYEPTSEDVITNLNQLILKARQLLGTADYCDVAKPFGMSSVARMEPNFAGNALRSLNLNRKENHETESIAKTNHSLALAGGPDGQRQGDSLHPDIWPAEE